MAQTSGSRRDIEQDLRAIDAVLGAWRGREVDGAAYAESLRPGDRLSPPLPGLSDPGSTQPTS